MSKRKVKLLLCIGCFSLGAVVGSSLTKIIREMGVQDSRTSTFPSLKNCLHALKYCLIKNLGSSKSRIYVIREHGDFVSIWPEFEAEVNKIAVIGFGCEWSDNKKGESQVTLMKLATHSGLTVLIQMNRVTAIPTALLNCLNDPDVIKVGVGCLEVAKKLLEGRDIIVNGCFDLRFLVDSSTYHIQGLGTRSLNVQYLDESMYKSPPYSVWDTFNLSSQQVHHAAEDAIVAVKIFVAAMVDRFIARPSLVIRSMDECLKKELWKLMLSECIRFKDLEFRDLRQIRLSHERPKMYASKSSKAIESYQTRKTPKYGNCLMQGPDGKPLTTCDRKKADWYIKHNLAELVCSKPVVVRLNFTPAGGPKSQDDYYLQNRDNVCVVCGGDNRLVRKSVVPYEYRKYFPVEMKSHTSHDVLQLCASCHHQSFFYDKNLHQQIAKDFGISMISEKKDTKYFEDPEIKKVKSAGTALLKMGDQIPMDRKEILQGTILAYFDQEHLNDELISKASKLDVKVKNNDYVAHGQLVVSILTKSNAYENICEFESVWRKHFVESMKPRFMPRKWSVEHRHPVNDPNNLTFVNTDNKPSSFISRPSLDKSSAATAHSTLLLANCDSDSDASDSPTNPGKVAKKISSSKHRRRGGASTKTQSMIKSCLKSKLAATGGGSASMTSGLIDLSDGSDVVRASSISSVDREGGGSSSTKDEAQSSASAVCSSSELLNETSNDLSLRSLLRMHDVSSSGKSSNSEEILSAKLLDESDDEPLFYCGKGESLLPAAVKTAREKLLAESCAVRKSSKLSAEGGSLRANTSEGNICIKAFKPKQQGVGESSFGVDNDLQVCSAVIGEKNTCVDPHNLFPSAESKKNLKYSFKAQLEELETLMKAKRARRSRSKIETLEGEASGAACYNKHEKEKGKKLEESSTPLVSSDKSDGSSHELSSSDLLSVLDSESIFNTSDSKDEDELLDGTGKHQVDKSRDAAGSVEKEEAPTQASSTDDDNGGENKGDSSTGDNNLWLDEDEEFFVKNFPVLNATSTAICFRSKRQEETTTAAAATSQVDEKAAGFDQAMSGNGRKQWERNSMSFLNYMECKWDALEDKVSRMTTAASNEPALKDDCTPSSVAAADHRTATISEDGKVGTELVSLDEEEVKERRDFEVMMRKMSDVVADDDNDDDGDAQLYTQYESSSENSSVTPKPGSV